MDSGRQAEPEHFFWTVVCGGWRRWQRMALRSGLLAAAGSLGLAAAAYTCEPSELGVNACDRSVGPAGRAPRPRPGARLFLSNFTMKIDFLGRKVCILLYGAKSILYYFILFLDC